MARQRKIKRYHYGSLNRKRRRGKVLKTLLFLLLLAGLIFVGYCVAKSIGDLSSRPESSSLPAEVSSVSQPGQSLPEESSLPPEESEEAPPVVQQGVKAVRMPADAATDPQKAADFLANLDPTAYNTVVVSLKNEKGQLSYQSAVPLAATCGAIPSGAMTLEALKALAAQIEAAGFTPAAQIYTLEDDYASHASYGTSYLYENQPGVTWLDQAADKGGRSWLNPYMPAAREYLDALTEEITAAGFSKIFAAGLQFPDTRFPQQMGYGPDSGAMTQAEALQAVLDGMEAAAAPNGGTLIPLYQGKGYLGEADALYGGSPAAIESGQAAATLPEGREAEVLAALPEHVFPAVTESQKETLGQEPAQYLVGPDE